MKIMFLMESYLPMMGGVELAVANVARTLVEKGHKAVVVTDRPSTELPRGETIEGIPVHRIRFAAPTTRITGNGKATSTFLFRFLSFPILMPIALVQLALLLRRERPHIVNVHYVGRNALYALVLRRVLRFRLFVNVVGFDLQRYPTASRASRWFIRAVLADADRILAYTNQQLSEVEAIEPRLLEKAGTVGQGVDLEEFTDITAFDHGKPYVLAIGNFGFRKGLDLLVRAIEIVHRDHQHLDLIIAGDGEGRPMVEDLSRRLGLQDSVTFFGRATRPEIGALLKGCEFLVLPSRQEAFGMVVLESMLAGKTVVATHVGGIPEVVNDGENGLLVQPESPEALAAGIVALVENPERVNSMAQEGRQNVRDRYSWDVITDRYLSYFEA